MIMRNAKDANYFQIDGVVKKLSAPKGAILLPSKEAWEKLKWTRKYFKKKPVYGYFVWIKEKINTSILTCISIVSEGFNQNLSNLFVIEKGINIEGKGICNVSKVHLKASHKAKGIIVLKEGASFNYQHIHRWGRDDEVKTDYHFILHDGSKLNYLYRTISPPKQLNIKTTVDSYKDSTTFIRLLSDSSHTKINLEEKINLLEKGASGIIELRLVGRKGSLIKAKSTIVAHSFSKGHLDCQGILIDKKSKISLIPELICKDKDAQITHEASVGKISQDQIVYLRTRGLSEKEAIELVINGFLNK